MNVTTRIILFLCLNLLTLIINQQFQCDEPTYIQYLKNQSRKVLQEQKSQMYKKRCEAFTKKMKQLEQIRKNYSDPDKIFNKYAKYMDRTQQELSNIITVGTVASSTAAINGLLRPVSDILKSVTAVPPSLDYRALGKTSSIKDQGLCGCCWSFTSVGLYESFMMVKGEQQYDLSEQYILECTTRFTKNVVQQNYQSTCAGGYVDFAGQLVRINGVPTQSAFPYVALTYTGTKYPQTAGICEAKPTYMYAKNPSVTQFSLYRNISNSDMKALLVNGPVGVLFYANTEFQAYKSGVFSSCPTSFNDSYDRINHAVIVVGYTLEGDYIIKNSWGTDWGESGYGTVSQSKDCALTAFAYQYTSSQSPGSGVQYNNQIDLGSQSGQKATFMNILILIMVSIIMTV